MLSVRSKYTFVYPILIIISRANVRAKKNAPNIIDSSVTAPCNPLRINVIKRTAAEERIKNTRFSCVFVHPNWNAFLNKEIFMDYFFLWSFSRVTRSGLPMKIDEYVPTAIPMISASENDRVASGPKTYRAISASTVVKEVLIDRVNV